MCVCVCVCVCVCDSLHLLLLIISIYRNRENKIREMETVITALKDREINGDLELEILNSIQCFSQNTSGLDVNDVSYNNGLDFSKIGRTYDVMARTSQGKSFIISSASSIPSNISSPLSPTVYEKRTVIDQDNYDDNDEVDSEDKAEKSRDNHALEENLKGNKKKRENEGVNDGKNDNKNGNSSISGYEFDAECFDLTSALNGFRNSEFQDRIERVGEREGGRMREREREKNMIIENIENRMDSSTLIDENRMFSVSRNILPSKVHVTHSHDARTAYASSGSTYTTQSDINLDKNIEVNNDDCENEQNSSAKNLKLNLKLKSSGFSSPSSSDETSIGKFSPSRFSDFSSDLECLSKKLDALSHINISGLRTSNSR